MIAQLYSTFSKCLLVICLGTPAHLIAQHQGSLAVPLDFALNTVLLQNAVFEIEEMRQKQHKIMERTSHELSPTYFNGDLGQYNTFNFDTRVGVLQTFKWPTTYKRNKDLLQSLTKEHDSQLAVTELGLKGRMHRIYSGLAYLIAYQSLLKQNDSLYIRNLALAANQSVANPEDLPALDKFNANLQHLDIEQRLKDVSFDILALQHEWQLLAQTQEWFIPSEKFSKMSTPLTASPKAALMLDYYNQRLNTSMKQIEVVKTALLPEITIGYSYQSLTGMQTIGGVDVNYTGVPAFSVAHWGLAVPIFQKATKARIEAAKVEEQINAKELQLAEQRLKFEDTQRKQLVQKYDAYIQFMEQKSIPESEKLLAEANKGFSEGKIGIVEWSELMNDVLEMKEKYLAAMHDHNMAMLSLIYGD